MSRTRQDQATFVSGSLTLSRICTRCASPRARLIVIHGYGDHSGRYRHFYDWLADRCIESHGVDLRGHGLSGGRRGFVESWDDHLDDLQAFLTLPTVREPALPTFILGHSHGGFIVAVAGVRQMLDGIRGCILSSPYLRNRMPIPTWKIALAHVANHAVPWLRVQSGLNDEWMTSDPAMLADSRADKLLNRGATPRWFLQTRAIQQRILHGAGDFRQPLLCLVGGVDRIADGDSTVEFCHRAGSTDKIVRHYPRMRHELLRESEREQVFAEVMQFMQNRL